MSLLKLILKKTLIILCFLALNFSFFQKESLALLSDGQSLKIASWNLFDFGGKFGGVSKGSDDTILDAMRDVMKNYDIIFVQEIAGFSSTHKVYTKDMVCEGLQEDIVEGDISDTKLFKGLVKNYITNDRDDYAQLVKALNKFIDDYQIDISKYENTDEVTKISCSGNIIPPLVDTVLKQFLKIGDFKTKKVAELPTRYQGETDTVFTSFNNLCNAKMQPIGYSCKATGKVGSSEGYGIIYKKSLGLKSVDIEWTGDITTRPRIQQGKSGNKLARPPMKATLTLKNGKKLIVYNVHTSPSGGVTKEIKNLSNAITHVDDLTKNNVIMLGDLNADGNAGFPNYILKTASLTDRCKATYYRGAFRDHQNDFTQFDGWYQTVTDYEITNFARTTQCAYDRMIISKALKDNAYEKYGIVKSVLKHSSNNSLVPRMTLTPFNQVHVGGGTTGKLLSDHRLIWSKFHFGAISPTDISGKEKFIFKESNNLCNDPLFYRGINFVPHQEMEVYVYNKINKSESFELYDKKPIKDEQAEINGDIKNHKLVNFKKGKYTIIVDIDKNKRYDPNIDVTEDFVVVKCPQIASRSAMKVDIVEKLRNNPKASSYKTRSSISKRKSDGPQPARKKVKFTNHSGIRITQAKLEIINYNNQNIVETIKNISIDKTGGFEVDLPTIELGLYNLKVTYTLGGSYPVQHVIYDYSDQAGFIVTDGDGDAGDNDVFTPDNNGRYRQDFNTAVAAGIHLFGKNFPPTTDPNNEVTVNVYVVSIQRLKKEVPNWSGKWSDIKDLDLAEVSIPLQKGSKNQIKPVLSSGKGELFSAIINPSLIIGMSSSTQENAFLKKYGSRFNMVVDTNKDGKFTYDDPKKTTIEQDRVDISDVSKITAWLNKKHILNEYSTGSITLDNGTTLKVTDVIKQYQELLNNKLNIPQLKVDGHYGPKTQSASYEFICSGELDQELVTMLRKSSQVGFKILQPEEYWKNRNYDGHNHNLYKVTLNNTSLRGNSCWNIAEYADFEETEYEDDSKTKLITKHLSTKDAKYGNNTNTHVKAHKIELNGTHELDLHAALCLEAGTIEVGAAGLGVTMMTVPEPFFTKIFAGLLFIIVGVEEIVRITNGCSSSGLNY